MTTMYRWQYWLFRPVSREGQISIYLTRLRAGQLLCALAVTYLLFFASSALAFGNNECAASRKGSDLGCTAGDVSITGIAVAPGSPTSCVGGTTFLVDLDITVNFATPDRWDIGIFLSQDGNDPQSLPANGGAATCSVGILPTSSPFLDLDPNGGTDTCGDGNGAINGGTGSGVVRLTNVPVACQAINLSGGNLYIPFVVSWDNQSSPSGATCASIADPVPNTVSKCNAPKTTVATEVAYGTVNAVVLPAISKDDGVAALNPGDPTTYTVVITNTTGVPLNNAVFTDPAAANLNVSSVSCIATGGATCPATTVAAMQGAGITIPTMPVGSIVTFTISATLAATPAPPGTSSVTNTARVTVAGESNSASDTDTIIGAVFSDLSTSTKTVLDLNGGEADPGDVLRYTITLKESSGNPSFGVSVTDQIPAAVNSFAVFSIPAGATNSSTGAGTGSNGNGYLNVTGITVPANGSVTVVFDVTITSGTLPGSQINNIATVTNPGGPGGNPPAPTVTVSPSNIPITANKILYLYGGAATPYKMSRKKPAGTPTTAAIAPGAAGAALWDGNWDGSSLVPLQLDNTIASATATLYLTAGDSNARKAEARLYCSNTPTVYASSGEYNLGDVPAATGPYSFNLTTLAGGFTFPHTCTTPNYWILRLENKSTGGRTITVVPVSGGNYSRVNLNSSNVLFVNTPTFYDAPYPAGAVVTSVNAGTTVYIRSVISDPFGSFDISSATLTLTDSSDTPRVASPPATAWNQVIDSGAATKTYEYAYTVPANGPDGYWVAKVNATEGTEGTVTDDAVASVGVVVPMPNLLVVKSAQTFSDPVNGTTAPKAIPGAFMNYTITVTNFGPGTVDTDSTVITDPIPANTELFVGDIDGAGPASGPILFTDGATASGLSYTFTSLANATDNLAFSGNNGADYNKNNTAPDSNECDPTVTNIKIPLSGIFNGSDGTNHPSFNVKFRVRIK